MDAGWIDIISDAVWSYICFSHCAFPHHGRPYFSFRTCIPSHDCKRIFNNPQDVICARLTCIIIYATLAYKRVCGCATVEIPLTLNFIENLASEHKKKMYGIYKMRRHNSIGIAGTCICVIFINYSIINLKKKQLTY